MATGYLWFGVIVGGCGANAESDSVVVGGVSDDSEAVALVSGRRDSRCVPLGQSVFTGDTDVGVGNLMSGGVCPEWVGVLASGHAVQLLGGSQVEWSDEPGDMLSVDLSSDARSIPLSVWIVRGKSKHVPTSVDLSVDSLADDVKRAVFDVSRLESLLAPLAGLRPDEEISLVGDDPSMIGASGPDPTADNDACWHLASAVSYGACDSVAAWAQSCGAYATDRLNVYYGSYDANRGRSCPEQGLVIVGTRANGETLAHELGHLMLASADHADSRPANVMCASGCMQIRNDFAVGQAFRMSAHSRGVVNERGWRAGPTLDCDLPGNCPEVLLDVSR
jgi:hypothetical protein